VLPVRVPAMVTGTLLSDISIKNLEISSSFSDIATKSAYAPETPELS
jgi:hypothetical protein